MNTSLSPPFQIENDRNQDKKQIADSRRWVKNATQVRIQFVMQSRYLLRIILNRMSKV